MRFWDKLNGLVKLQELAVRGHCVKWYISNSIRAYTAIAANNLDYPCMRIDYPFPV